MFEMMTKTETNQLNSVEGSSDVMYVFLDVHLKKLLCLLIVSPASTNVPRFLLAIAPPVNDYECVRYFKYKEMCDRVLQDYGVVLVFPSTVSFRCWEANSVLE